MAKIVCISKYPPLEGGIAAKTYWLAKALGERGHEVHIITDDVNVEPEYSVVGNGQPRPSANVHVHRPDVAIPWHIPDDRHRTISLLDCAIRVINDVHPDVIDTGYLVPYGIVGFLASQSTGVPFVLRHGGSDLAKFLENNIWPEIFQRVFAAASAVITDQAHIDVIRRLSTASMPIVPYVPDPKFFNTERRTRNIKPVLALIGKANYHWRHKGWHRVVEILRGLSSVITLTVVCQGKGLCDFRAFVEKHCVKKVECCSFVPPWEMPALLKKIDGVFVFSGDFPFPAFSNLALEALYVGTTIITDGPYQIDQYKREGLNLGNLPGAFLPVPAYDPGYAAKLITEHFENISMDQTFGAPSHHDFQEYISTNEKCLFPDQWRQHR